MKNYFKSISIVLITVLITSCSNNQETSNNNFPSRWVSESNSKYQVWFQNWSDYTRLFIKINQDTILVSPNKYATVEKGKEYLFPKDYKQILSKQMIGNIKWINDPIWDTNNLNSFIWIIDRSNPKIKLPKKYICEKFYV